MNLIFQKNIKNFLYVIMHIVIILLYASHTFASEGSQKQPTKKNSKVDKTITAYEEILALKNNGEEKGAYNLAVEYFNNNAIDVNPKSKDFNDFIEEIENKINKSGKFPISSINIKTSRTLSLLSKDEENQRKKQKTFPKIPTGDDSPTLEDYEALQKLMNEIGKDKEIYEALGKKKFIVTQNSFEVNSSSARHKVKAEIDNLKRKERQNQYAIPQAFLDNFKNIERFDPLFFKLTFNSSTNNYREIYLLGSFHNRNPQILLSREVFNKIKEIIFKGCILFKEHQSPYKTLIKKLENVNSPSLLWNPLTQYSLAEDKKKVWEEIKHTFMPLTDSIKVEDITKLS